VIFISPSGYMLKWRPFLVSSLGPVILKPRRENHENPPKSGLVSFGAVIASGSFSVSPCRPERRHPLSPANITQFQQKTGATASHSRVNQALRYFPPDVTKANPTTLSNG